MSGEAVQRCTASSAVVVLNWVERLCMAMDVGTLCNYYCLKVHVSDTGLSLIQYVKVQWWD